MADTPELSEPELSLVGALIDWYERINIIKAGEIGYLLVAVRVVAETLRQNESVSDAWKPWTKLADALFNLEAGLQPELLTAKRTKNPGLRPTHAIRMAIGAAVVSKAPKNKRKDVCRLAARCLKIPTKKLWNFRKNLMKGWDGPLRSEPAHAIYEICMHDIYVPMRSPNDVEPEAQDGSKSPPTYEDWLRTLKPLQG